MTAYTIEAFYDRHIRLWTCLWIDSEGNQAGDAQYATNRKAKDQLCQRMQTIEPADYQVA